MKSRLSVSDDKVKNILVATKPPEGMIVHTEFGITMDTKTQIQDVIARTKGIKGLKWVSAAEVGLEWRDSQTNRRSNITDALIDKAYVCVSPNTN